MLSDTFREESQRKQCLRTKARSDSDTSCGVVVRKAAETGMLFPRFSPDAIYCSNETGEELLSISSANSESKTHSMLQSSEEEPGKKMSTLLITRFNTNFDLKIMGGLQLSLASQTVFGAIFRIID